MTVVDENSGAGGSKGRTSWTAKAELQDYISFVGFMIYYMHHMSSYNIYSSAMTSNREASFHDLTPIPSQALPTNKSSRYQHSHHLSTLSLDGTPDDTFQKHDSRSVLLLGGYSYGSLITTQLPSLQSILNIFHAPDVGTTAGEIRLRAQKIAEEQNEKFVKLAETLHATSTVSPVSHNGDHQTLSIPKGSRKVAIPGPIRVGGEETQPELRRVSQDARHRRSLSYDAPEKLRRSLDRVRSISRRHNDPRSSVIRHKSYSPTVSPLESGQSSRGVAPISSDGHNISAMRSPNLELADIKAAYLLISPLQGLVQNLTTMWSKISMQLTILKQQPGGLTTMSEEEVKLVMNQTLAIYGDSDVFTSSKRLRKWSERLQSVPGSQFCFEEIDGAGHFWHEQGVAMYMRDLVTNFAQEL